MYSLFNLVVMAENTDKKEQKKKPTYKFGQKEIDLNTYIYNLGTNLQDYVGRQKDWSEGQKEEFNRAYNQYIQGLIDQRDNGVDRFYTDDMGVITDKQGLLNNTDNDDIDPNGSEYYYDQNGNRITTDDYNLMKERKQKKFKTFSANREVAKYFNQIGKYINPVTSQEESKEESKEKFDLAKHGFINWWQKRNNPDGGEMDYLPYLNKDVYDPTTKKRARTNRLSYLSDELDSFLKEFNGDYDYSGGSYESAEQYKEALSNLLASMRDGTWDDSDKIAANKAGISEAFYNTFFTEDEHPGRTQSDINAENQKEQAALSQKEQDEWIAAQQKIFNDNNYQQTYHNPFYLGAINANYYTDAEGYNGDAFRSSFEEDSSAWNKFYDKKKKQLDVQGYLNEYLANPFNFEGKRAMAALIGSGYAKKLASGKYQGSYYIPQYDRDRRTNSALIYNPISGSMFYTFIGDIPDEWKRMTEQYKLDKGIIKAEDAYRFENGGVISIMQIGGGFDFNAWNEEDRQTNLKNRAKESGRSVRQQEAGERKPGGTTNAQNPEDGKLKATDVARIASSIADIGSMVTGFWNPAVSAGIGLGSTATTLVTDIAEDGFQWGDAGRALTNAGLDILGAIPMGVGAVSKKVKIARTLGRYASRALAAVSVASGLANSDNIIASINKMTESPKELTVDDWRNIAQGFGLLTGGIGAGLRKWKQVDVNTKNTKQDVVALEFADKQGNKRMFAFDGEDAKAIRQAQETGNVDEIKRLTSGKYEELRDMDLAVQTESKLQLPYKDGKWRSIREKVPVGAKVYDVIKGKNGPVAQTGKWDADVSIRKTMNEQTDLLKSKVDADVKAYQDALFEPMKTASDRKVKQIKRIEDEAIPQAEKRIKDKYTAAGVTDRNALETRVRELETIHSKRHNVNGSTVQSDYDLRLATQTQNIARRDQLVAQPTRTSAEEAELTALNEKINLEQQWLTNNSEPTLQSLQKQMNEVITNEKWLARLRGQVGDYKSKRKHTKEYDDFVRQYVTGTGDDAVIKITGLPHGRPDIELKAKEILDRYYKEGGSIDFSKIRKFGGGGNSSIRNTTSTANWYDDMFNTTAMTNFLASLNKTNYKQVNDLQDSWLANRNATGWNGNNSSLSFSDNVKTRQGVWNGLGLNEGITNAVNSGKIKPSGNSGDNSKNGYTDGFFGHQESLRHFGTADSWKGRESELKTLQETLAQNGLSYTLGEDGMYRIGELEQPQQITQQTSQQVSSNQSTNGSNNHGYTTPADDNETESENSFSINQIFNKRLGLPYDTLRMFVNDIYNRKVTDIQNSGQPFYQKTYDNIYEPITSDLHAETQGKQAHAQLSNIFSKARTSNIEDFLAGRLDAEVKGLQFEIDGAEKSNQKIDTTTVRNVATANEQVARKTNVANQNALSAHQFKENVKANNAAHASTQGNNIRAFLEQKEYYQRQEQEKNKAFQEQYALYDINQAATYDLKNQANKLGFSYDESDMIAYNKWINGTEWTSLNTQEQEGVNRMRQLARQVENTLIKQYKGISSSPWSNIRSFTSSTDANGGFNIKQTGEFKNGGSLKEKTKIRIANLKSEEADADRFQKSMEASMKRHQKLIDNLARNTYRLIDIEIVK